uniref:Uncharacterized protein n=1 Tax=Chelydra serpentina TaxID=8475 RepID=A0A8C3SLX0_CHESE
MYVFLHQDYQNLPIDIQTSKLNLALSHSQPRVTGYRILPAAVPALCLIPDIHYFHCLRIVEILRGTEASTKNIFGRYSSQRMKDWQEILSLYEKENTYLGKAASPHHIGPHRRSARGSCLLSSCPSSGWDLLGMASAWHELTCTPRSHALSQVPASRPTLTSLSLLQPV